MNRAENFYIINNDTVVSATEEEVKKAFDIHLISSWKPLYGMTLNEYKDISNRTPTEDYVFETVNKEEEKMKSYRGVQICQ